MADLFLYSVAFLEYGPERVFLVMINPPIALYYMQGLNNHTSSPGMQHIWCLWNAWNRLMLFCLRVMWVQSEWKESLLKLSFWSLNNRTLYDGRRKAFYR